MTVNQIIADPSRDRNREVLVSGAVVDSDSLANRGARRIDDGTGQLWVVTETGVPGQGARVTTKGEVARDSISARWEIGSACRREWEWAWS